ncbi:single-pass membrane and coiled-coil domain-containing protein 2 isoform X2 [Monodelphis domestica]|uniref:single-pass membrane and coiled-coil domain-containing protein 2 isoform X2 n=1 Tax=Monodelphis domestica TaxID=13616 RepID=UPI0024E24A2D|nr:single-pass membrane and coiled-coil domain-containing protein 2 isoform X2 [Monodelphis domestica]
MEIPSQNSSVREGAQLKEWKHLQEEKEAEQEVEKSRESKAEPEEKTEELFLKMKNLNEMILLQMKIVRDELQQWIEKNNNFLKKIYSSEYTMQGLLREMTKIDYLIEKSDDEDSSLSGNEHPQKLEAKKWFNNTFTEVQKFKTKLLQRIEDMMDSDVEKNEAQSNQKNGQKIDDTKTQDLEPLLPVSSFLSEEDTLSYPEDQIEKNMLCKLNYWNARMFLQVKKLGIDHKDWIEKNDIIVQKIKATEETVKNLLNEVIKMENQMEQLEANQCQYLEIKEELSKQEKIMMIKRELEEMNSKFVQVNPCNEAQELKRKLIVQIENFYKDMTVMNTELEKYQLRQLEETEAEMITMRDVEDTKPMARRTLFLGTNASKWKRVLWSFVFFYASTSIGFLCYVLFIDPTFIFETMIPGILGRRRMWELKELVAPFWNLEMEDLLPS